MMWMGAEGTPICPAWTLPYSLASNQPLVLGQFLKGCALSFLKDHFSSFKHLQPKSLEHKS